MLRSETTYRHRLHASGPTIVAQGDARDAMQGIGHVCDTEGQHLFTVEDMQGCRTRHLMLATALCDCYLLKLMNPVRHGVVTNVLAMSRQ